MAGFLLHSYAMSKPKAAVQGIASLYRTDTIDKVLFGYVRSRLTCQASLTVTDALQHFLDEFDLVDEMEIPHAHQIYQRMNAHFRANEGI